ncbi:hypothetical protein RQM47_05545 [Rubrivirga sp. S365]|uniref:golvesin C-terminal-like domain-containing protein n=1 Tax=Rubrivirga sp. S365 TaxID=3076080 RepID=UPI0028CA936C|nr:hypothetical protein [Rubrivirga sp. S365]MDT7856097.1 hypothetical protein [Rubrivirga sp. S365]
MPIVLRPALLLVVLAVAGCASSGPAAPPAPDRALTAERAERLDAVLGGLLSRCRAGGCALPVGRGVEVDSVVVAGGAVEVRFSRDLGDAPVRPATAAAFTHDVAAAVGRVLPGVPVRVVTRGAALEALVPNAYRDSLSRDPSRLFAPPEPTYPLTRPAAPPAAPTAGLAGRHVALWPSHGWLFNPETDDWGWQRARLFTTVEDLLTVQLVTQTLVPILERAGAVVLLPRERDPQAAEVVVDDGGPGYAEAGAWADGGPGFGLRAQYGDGQNPFALGTTREGQGAATWTADLPAPGAYAVHVSYAGGAGRADRSERARYTVRHAGGESAVLVNQTMGGGTWVYLGTWEFDGPASATLTSEGGAVSADAVRFGGGVGVVAREGQTSGRPRWTEAARYYEQYAGAPPAVYNVTGEPDADYVDDYRSRGEWVNWLRGAPFGPSFAPDDPGLGIPVDLSLAWHTDAGIDRDGTVGTLLIYDSPGMDSTGTFADGTSRLANRDLADRLQTTIVDDLRATFDPAWTRRALWDRNYSEAARPAVPSALLELLSHQNFRDMQFGLDPRFQAVAARAVYKAMGRSLAEQRGRSFVVQPLRPTHLQATFEGGAVRLAWRPQADPLEPTAAPDAYLVQTRDGERGWSEGTLVQETHASLPAPPPGVVRSYRVVAVNAGGAGAPSVALAVGLAPGAGRPVLVVDAFDRVAPPASVALADSAGFVDTVGVPDGRSVLTVGAQRVFDPDLAYESDAQPGWGASGAELEATVVAGNTHDHAAAHGAALLALGHSFVSATDEAVESGAVALDDYAAVDLALGLERRTPHPDSSRAPDFEALPAPLRDRLGAYLDGGGALVVSGAHWLSDAAADPASAAWVRRYLGAEAGGAAPDAYALDAGAGLVPFAASYGPDRYAVRAPDVVRAGGAGRLVARYADGQGAAVASGRTASFGVPLEAVPDVGQRAALLTAALAAAGVR